MSESEEEIRNLKRQVAEMSDVIETQKAAQRLPKNMDFVQISRSEMREIAALGEKNKLALSILMILTQAMNKQNAVMMSYDAMATLTGRAGRSLRRAVKLLKDDRWVQIVKVGSTNVYVINSSVFWTDRGDKKYLSNFSAQVVTTLDEQDKDIRESPKIELKRISSLLAPERVILNDEELPPPDQQDLKLT